MSLQFAWIDALIEILREDWQDAETSPDEIEAGFREALYDAIIGNVRPIESLWDDLDVSDESEISDS